jgi:hypothetical protein
MLDLEHARELGVRHFPQHPQAFLFGALAEEHDDVKWRPRCITPISSETRPLFNILKFEMWILDYSEDVSERVCHRGDFDVASDVLNLPVLLCS